MYSLRRRSSLVLFAVFIYLIAGLSVAEGIVLCIEEDGHLTIEMAQNGLCGVPSEPTVTDTHCGSCVDIPIYTNASGDIVAYSKKVSQQIDVLEFSADSPAIHTLKKTTTPIFSKHIQVSSGSTLASLRAVILLI